MYRLVASVLLLLALSTSARAKKSAQQKAQDQLIERAAAQQLKEHPDEAQKLVDRRVAEKIEARAQQLSILRDNGGNEARWLSLPRLYLGNTALRGDACSGLYCRPSFVSPFGLEGALHVLGIFDVFARFGGVVYMYGDAPEVVAAGLGGKTKWGMEVVAGARVHLWGFLGVSAGFDMWTESFDKIVETPRCSFMTCEVPTTTIVSSTLTSYGAHLGVYISIRGITVSGFAKLLYRQALLPNGEQRGDFAPFLGVELVTPALLRI